MNEEWCAVCNQKIYKGDTLYLIMNNHVLFPNVYVHDTCVEPKEECVAYLTNNYKEFKGFVEKYKSWIDKIYEV